MDKKARLQELCALYDKWVAAYESGSSPVSDEVFDAVRDEIAELDPENPRLLQTGSDKLVPGWEKVAHYIKMHSQDKVNTEPELTKWAKKTLTDRYMVQEKLDGLSVECVYANGRLAQGITRGDGNEGEDITRNVVKMKNVRRALPVGISGSLRGEILLPLDIFRAKYSVEALGEEKGYSNPRNAAAGISRRLDGEGCEDLVIYYYDVIVDGREFKSELEKVLFISERMELDTVRYAAPLTLEKVLALYRHYGTTLRETLNWEIDGLVIKCSELETQEALGFTPAGRPRGQIAFKFAALSKTTYLVDVEWEVGNTGRVTPVAIVEPVQVGGVEVERATLHNLAQFRKHKLYRGAPVAIRRANDVIPEFVGIVEGMEPKHVERQKSAKELKREQLAEQAAPTPNPSSPWWSE